MGEPVIEEQLIIPVTYDDVEALWTFSRRVDQHCRHALLTASSASFFADITLRIEPVDQVDHVSFCSAVHPDPTYYDALDVWVAGVRDGVIAFLEARVCQRHPMTGIRITLLSLSEHPVDSKRLAYQRAAVIAMQEACAQTGALTQVSYPYHTE